MTKIELIARIAELEAECASYAETLGVARVTKIKNAPTHKYMTTLVKHDGSMKPYTPSAVDLIRAYYYKNVDNMTRADMISRLISRGLTPATVRTRISRIENGIDESCFNVAIRERLGLIETADAE